MRAIWENIKQLIEQCGHESFIYGIVTPRVRARAFDNLLYDIDRSDD